jgi:Arc/MetJ-type ribon-helix-helix transcriptional regulator
MKVSVSLPDEQIDFLDAYARAQGGASRSAVIRDAVQLLRARELDADYAQVWAEWDGSGDGAAWEPVTGDGIRSAS